MFNQIDKPLRFPQEAPLEKKQTIRPDPEKAFQLLYEIRMQLRADKAAEQSSNEVQEPSQQNSLTKSKEVFLYLLHQIQNRYLLLLV